MIAEPAYAATGLHVSRRGAFGCDAEPGTPYGMTEDQVVPTRGDGHDEILALDTNGDGKPDLWAIDTDGDGKPDLFQSDVDGDGEVELTMVDLDQDGTMDIKVDGDGGHPPAPQQ